MWGKSRLFLPFGILLSLSDSVLPVLGAGSQAGCGVKQVLG